MAWGWLGVESRFKMGQESHPWERVESESREPEEGRDWDVEMGSG